MKRRDEKILVHLAPALKAEIQASAEAKGRSVSSYVRELLISHATARLTEEKL